MRDLPTPLSETFEGRRYWRRARLMGLVAGMCLGFIEIAGVPHLRVFYERRVDSSYITHAWYWTPTAGWREGWASEFKGGEGCPLVILVPLERSIVLRGVDAAIAVASQGWNSLCAHVLSGDRQ